MSIAQKLCNEIVEPVLQVNTRGTYVYVRGKVALRPPSRCSKPTNPNRNTDGQKTGTNKANKNATSYKFKSSIGPVRKNCRRKQQQQQPSFNKASVAQVTEDSTHTAGPLMYDHEYITNVRSRPLMCGNECITNVEIEEPDSQVNSRGTYVYVRGKAALRPPSRSSNPTNSNRNTEGQKTGNNKANKNTTCCKFTSINSIGPVRKNYRRKQQQRSFDKASVALLPEASAHTAGPLMCDNECITNVRNRESRDTDKCKCEIRKTNCMLISKEVQTLSMNTYASVDKACMSLDVKLVDYGVQCENWLDKQMVDNFTMPIKIAKFAHESSRETPERSLTPPTNKIYHSCKRWSLGPTKHRGPDF